ncbi:hypothetical protein DF186_23675, partial [Enterococcus hirae]
HRGQGVVHGGTVLLYVLLGRVRGQGQFPFHQLDDIELAGIERSVRVDHVPPHQAEQHAHHCHDEHHVIAVHLEVAAGA